MSSPLEIFERNKLGQLLSFYCLFRKLWPKEEDRKIWKSLWKTQKKTPIIILHGHVSLFIGEYMLEIVPLTKKSSRKRPKNEKENIRKYLSRLDISFETDIHTLYIHFTSLISKEICLSNNLVDKKDVKNIDENLNYKAKFILSA